MGSAAHSVCFNKSGHHPSATKPSATVRHYTNPILASCVPATCRCWGEGGEALAYMFGDHAAAAGGKGRSLMQWKYGEYWKDYGWFVRISQSEKGGGVSKGGFVGESWGVVEVEGGGEVM